MARALLDTSVVIDWDLPEVSAALPTESAISVITLAELTAGPHLARTSAERSRRQARLQQVESRFEPLPLDANVARSYGHVVAAISEGGRSPRGRFADLMIAATAHAYGLALVTRNPGDFMGLSTLIEVVSV